MGDAIIFDGVPDHPAQERDISSRANLQKQVGGGGGAREARIHHDHLGVTGALGLDGPLESAGMVLCRVPAHDQHHVGVLDIGVAIGHGSAPKSWSQT